MASPSMTAAVFGSTGLVGSHILTTLLGTDTIKTVYTCSRRAPNAESPKLTAHIQADSSVWTAYLTEIKPPPELVFSALGTTRAQAGGIDKQWKIDHDLNIEIAKTAKADGVKTYVFVSSAGTRGGVGKNFPYSKMKVGVEDAIENLGFDNAIVLRPGLIMGKREVEHTGGPLMNSMVRGLGYISKGFQDAMGQDADVIGRAAVHAAILASRGEAPKKFWVLETHDIIRLGRDEWKDL